MCLSLLNTWSGDRNEKWLPGTSTMLQVLVSIQGLILNTKPYFNEPGFASMSGSAAGEKRSLQYNESTFILSLQTMMYSIKRPPKVNFVTCNPLSLNFTFFYGKIYNCFLLALFKKKICDHASRNSIFCAGYISKHSCYSCYLKSNFLRLEFCLVSAFRGFRNGTFLQPCS